MSGSVTPNTTEILRKEYDYALETLDIVAFNGASYSFLSHFVFFTYEESIFTAPHGQILVVDAVDYPTLLPIIGEEKIRATFTRQDENANILEGALLDPITFELNVYSMQGKVQTGASMKRQNYSLLYTSELPFLNATQRVFKAYKSKLYSDIVAEICAQYLTVGKKVIIEPTLYAQDYIIQNEKPIGAIRKITQRAISAETDEYAIPNGSYYLFFEDRDTIYFTTISKLMQSAPVIELRYEPKHTTKDNFYKEIEKDIYNVDSFNQSSAFDVLSSISSGEGGGTMLAVDPIRRKRTMLDFDLHRDYDKIQHLEKSKRFTATSKFAGKKQGNFKMILSNKEHDTLEHIVARDATIKPNFIDDMKLLRESQKAQIMGNVFTVIMSGDPRVRAGSVVKFRMPEMMGKVNPENPQELDKYLQGKYLVAAVRHVIKNGEYRMILELLRDTVFSDIQHRDPQKIYESVK